MDIPEEPSEGNARVELWFGDRVDPSGIGSSLVVHRDIPATRAIATSTLRAWIDGPTAEEEAVGALPSAPDGTELLGIDVDEGTAVVDLSSEFERTGAGTTYEGTILDQLAGTITQFETVDRALLKIDGESKPDYMGHGFIVDEQHPLVRPAEERYRTARRC
ncbi:MAG: GerMN domain-containing protein [Actinomycetota bacterium]